MAEAMDSDLELSGNSKKRKCSIEEDSDADKKKQHRPRCLIVEELSSGAQVDHAISPQLTNECRPSLSLEPSNSNPETLGEGSLLLPKAGPSGLSDTGTVSAQSNRLGGVGLGLLSSGADSDSDNEAWQRPVNRRRRRTRPVDPTPELAEYPVILEDVGREGDVRYHHYGQFTTKLFVEAGIAPIRRQRRLGPNRWLIHCQTQAAQLALSKKLSLGYVKIKCYIPTHKTVGVVRPIPISVSMDTITADNPKLIVSATRLNLLSREPSQAVKIVFNTQTLPDVVCLGNELMRVTPFTEPVLRCTKCQKLGHSKGKCPAKTAICARCGKQAHHTDSERNQAMCPATMETSFCVNCRVKGHSAAWKGCPTQKLHQRALTESARLGIPVGVIMRKISSADPSDLKERDHSYYVNKVPAMPPTSSTLHKSDNPHVSSSGGHATVVKETSSQQSHAVINPTSSPEAEAHYPPLPPRPAPVDLFASRAAASVREETVQKQAATAAGDSSFKEQLSAVSSMVQTWMSDLSERFTLALEKQSQVMETRLRELETGPALANSIADKLSERRKLQIQDLRKKSSEMLTSHPVAKLLGKCMVDIVSAVELNQPHALLQTMTQLYNDSHKDQSVAPPVWNEELSDICGLALGVSECSSVMSCLSAGT